MKVDFFNLHQDKVRLWLNAALKKEEENWLSGKTPELIDHYCFSPLAIDVIQVNLVKYRWDTGEVNVRIGEV